MLKLAGCMRTTLDIDDDVLAAAKELARRQGVSAGRVVSRLMRNALSGEGMASSRDGSAPAASVAGFRPFAPHATELVTNAQVEALREQEGV